MSGFRTIGMDLITSSKLVVDIPIKRDIYEQFRLAESRDNMIHQNVCLCTVQSV